MSSIEGVRYDLSEVNDHLEEFKEAFDRRLDDAEYFISKVNDKLQDLDEKIDGVEVCLLSRIHEVEEDMDVRCADLNGDMKSGFNDIESRFNDIDGKFNDRFNDVNKEFGQFRLSVKSQFENSNAFRQNEIADRFYATVAPIEVEYTDSSGHTHYRFPPWTSSICQILLENAFAKES